MKPDLILQADLLDIVFEYRNKDYGAYVLRKEYPRELQRALLFVLFGVAVTSFLFLNTRNTKQMMTVREFPVVHHDTLSPPPLPPETPPPAPALPRATIEHVTTVIANDGTDTIPTIEQLDQPVQIGTTTQAGDSTDVVGPVAPQAEAATGNAAVPQPEAAPAVYRSVQEMPEFPGGTAALQRFLLKHLRVPDEVLEPGSKVSVQVQFIVDKNGTITGMKILKSGGELFNKEVLRVLNKMPAWKPGRQNGMQVPVYFELPVTFQVE